MIAARSDTDSTLLGLARVITDGLTIADLQDLLVRPAAQGAGVGGALLESLLHRVKDIRQLVLLCDAKSALERFYAHHNLVDTRKVGPEPLRAFVRLL